MVNIPRRLLSGFGFEAHCKQYEFETGLVWAESEVSLCGGANLVTNNDLNNGSWNWLQLKFVTIIMKIVFSMLNGLSIIRGINTSLSQFLKLVPISKMPLLNIFIQATTYMTLISPVLRMINWN